MNDRRIEADEEAPLDTVTRTSEVAMATTNTADRTPQPRFTPNEEWIDAFQEQATDELRKRAKRFARSRARVVASAGGHVDDYYVSALVQDVLTDTLIGVLTWDPAAVALEIYVLNAIRSRSHHDAARAKKHRSIDASDPRSEARAVMVEVESSLSFDQYTPSADALAFSDEVIAYIRRLAKTDGCVLRMLDAIELGATERSEIMQLAKMSSQTYHKARIRLGRLVERLPNEVLIGLRA